MKKYRLLRRDFFPATRTTVVPEVDYKERNPCEVLRRYLPDAAKETLFGNQKGDIETQDAVKIAAIRRCPIIPVYLVTTNTENEAGVRFLLHAIPNIIIYRISSAHFYTPEQGAYPGIGVDRLSAAKAAVGLTGLPALVIDGGTAMTYTAVDTKNNIIGGGICPGLQVQLSALGEYTGALPSLSHADVKTAVEECKKQKEPIQLFAKSTNQAILGSVFLQVAQHAFGIITGWQQQAKPQVEKAVRYYANKEEGERMPINKDMKVVVTGGDGSTIVDLLKKDHSGIIPVTQDHWSNLPKGFEVVSQKHM